MARIADAFAAMQASGRPGLIAYVTAGDPDLDRTAEILAALGANGADVLEVGVPFSDPLADGPVIQRASERALKSGTTLRKTLDMIRRRRAQITSPIVLFTYANPILRMGEAAFARAAADAGVDGVLVLDLPVEEARSFRQRLIDADMDPIFLLSLTTTDDRIRQSAELGRGFLYVI
jgi:tryptophan synthase alpha chain